MFEDLVSAPPNVEIEKTDGEDYYRAVWLTEFSTPSVVISGIVRGVTFSFQVPGSPDVDEVKRLIAAVTRGVQENVFLVPGTEPGKIRA